MYTDKDGRVHETTEEAREGVNVKGMTTVVVVSVVLAIVALIAVLVIVR